MTIKVDFLQDSDWDEYSSFVDSCRNGLVYHSSEYLKAISNIVGSEPLVLVARRSGEVLGSIASFLCKSDKGNILNSLPYFGSHGDILLADTDLDISDLAKNLAHALKTVMAENDVGAVNIVSHPVNAMISGFADVLDLRAWDVRIGQMTQLPRQATREEALANVLSSCTQKTRNLVRKGLRRGFLIRESDDRKDWDSLITAHTAGMARIGGTAKSKTEFSAIRETLGRTGHCRLYVAEADGVFAGGLLLLEYKDTVEYFTPVANEAFRNEQVLSALIAEAMCDSILRGATLWNWGGTWSNQAGVYHFKKGWGAIDKPYRYWGRASEPALMETPANELRDKFRYFYVRPFQQQISQTGN